MNKKIKVLFALPTLYGGGAERVVSYIPQHIDKDKFDVKLIIVGYEKDSTYKVKGIPVIFLNKSRVLFSIFSLLKTFFSEKPDIVLSSISQLNVLMGFLSIFFPKTKFIGRHTIVSQNKKKFTRKKENWFNRQMKGVYKSGIGRLDIILCQSVDMFKDMQINMYKVPEHKLRVIHNPMRNDFELKKARNSSQNKVIKYITVARLVPLKGHERILNSISKLNFPYQYTIVGDGRERQAIFELIDKLKLNDKIVHIPYTSEVSKYLSESDFYLQGSYAEGFPNCLIESCSVGTPVIAFNAPGGLNEIIEDRINGFLVENETEFIEKLNYSTKIEWDEKKVRDSVHKKFNLKKIINDYENLFLEVLNLEN